MLAFLRKSIERSDGEATEEEKMLEKMLVESAIQRELSEKASALE
jgi:hypothetical protein